MPAKPALLCIKFHVNVFWILITVPNSHPFIKK